MRRITLLFLLIMSSLVVIVGCSNKEEELPIERITMEEVETELTNQGILLNEINFIQGYIFMRNIEQKGYRLEDKEVMYVYVLDSVAEREETTKKLKEQTASYKVQADYYEVRNLLLVHVRIDEFDRPAEAGVKKAIEVLNGGPIQ